MGANHQKEIEQLCEIAQPDFGLITNFGRAHLEGFGGIDGVIKGKSEMFKYLNENKKTAFVHFDDVMQTDKSKDINRFGFSFLKNNNANIQISNAVAQPMASMTFNETDIFSHLTGLYNLPNIAFAITIGCFFNITNTQIKDAIENYIPENNRSQWLQKNNKNILLDAYNANPSSMQVAINNFKQLDGLNKLMILGDMFELGKDTDKEHLTIIKEALSSNIAVFFIGSKFFNNQITNNMAHYFKDKNEVETYLKNTPCTYSQILIKGSRAMSLEKLLNYL